MGGKDWTSLFGYFKLMALAGQISWQQKQTMHFSGSTSGILPSIDRADAGHWLTQEPHPVHRSGSACGRRRVLL